MTIRHPLRLAALAALAAFAGFGAQAIEATQWEARTESAAAAGPNTDGTREPLAWTVSRQEATQFHDAMARDTMASRAAVRQALAEARAQDAFAYAGEAGTVERMPYRGLEGVAMNAEVPVPHAEAGGSMYALAADGAMRPLPDEPTARMSRMEPEALLAGRPAFAEDDNGPLAESTTVATQ